MLRPQRCSGLSSGHVGAGNGDEQKPDNERWRDVVYSALKVQGHGRLHEEGSHQMIHLHLAHSELYQVSDVLREPGDQGKFQNCLGKLPACLRRKSPEGRYVLVTVSTWPKQCLHFWYALPCSKCSGPSGGYSKSWDVDLLFKPHVQALDLEPPQVLSEERKALQLQDLAQQFAALPLLCVKLEVLSWAATEEA